MITVTYSSVSFKQVYYNVCLFYLNSANFNKLYEITLLLKKYSTRKILLWK